MSDPTGQPPPDQARTPRGPARRRDRVRAEIARDRQGDHTVPTWVLAVVAGVILLAFLYVVVTQ